MKKFFIFVAIAMVFIMLTSGLAIGRKAAEDEPKETGGIITVIPGTTAATTEAPGIQEGLFYTVDGTSYTDEQLPTLADATYVYFVDDGVTRFARVFVEYGTMNSIDFLYESSAVPEYSENYCHKFLLDDGSYDAVDIFDLTSVPAEAYGLGAELTPVDDGGRVVAVFLELSNCADPASVLSKFVGNTEFCSYANCNDPEIPEGPSADVTTEATTEVTPPQVDPWVPEGPGAE